MSSLLEKGLEAEKSTLDITIEKYPLFSVKLEIVKSKNCELSNLLEILK
jgi:hypothetical protein